MRELAARHGLRLSTYSRKTLAFARIEAGLMRLRRDTLSATLSAQ